MDRLLSTYIDIKNTADLKHDDEGATAVEYGMMVALIAAVIVAIVAVLGNQVNAAFTTVSNQLPAAP